MKSIAILALSLAFAVGCSKPAEPAKDSIKEEATGPSAGDSGVGAVNKARSTADKASSQTYKGDEGEK